MARHNQISSGKELWGTMECEGQTIKRGTSRDYRDLGEPLTSQGALLTPEDLMKILGVVPGAQQGVNMLEDRFHCPRTGIKV